VAGTIIADVIQSDQSYPSSINIASPLVIANTISMTNGAISGNVNVSGNLVVTGVFTAPSITANASAVTIDNIIIDGTGIMSSNANGSIFVTPNGVGTVEIKNKLTVRSNAGTATTSLVSYRVSVSTSATVIADVGSDWGHLAIVTGLDGGGNFFTDLVFTCTTGGPTVLSSKTVSGGPAGRTYSMSSNKLALAMSSGTYDVRSGIFYGLQ